MLWQVAHSEFMLLVLCSPRHRSCSSILFGARRGFAYKIKKYFQSCLEQESWHIYSIRANVFSHRLHSSYTVTSCEWDNAKKVLYLTPCTEIFNLCLTNALRLWKSYLRIENLLQNGYGFNPSVDIITLVDSRLILYISYH